MVYSIGSPRDGSSSIKTIQSLTVRINQNELKLIAIEKWNEINKTKVSMTRENAFKNMSK